MNYVISRRCLVLITLLCALIPSLHAGPAFFEANFDNAATISTHWTGSAYTTEARDGGLALVLTSPSPSSSVYLNSTLSATDIKGRRIVLTAQVKATGLTTPPAAYNGIKIMLKYQTSNGQYYYPQVPVGHVTSGWDHVYTVFTLPEDVISAVLTLGVELTQGSVAFDDVRIEANPVVFRADFDVPAAISTTWGAGPHVTEAHRGAYALKIDHPTTASTYRTATLPTAMVNQIKGRRVVLRGYIKAANIVATASSLTGIKLMLEHTSGGTTSYSQVPADRGTFDWREIHQVVFLPANTTIAKITLGLEVGSGTVCFDDIHLDLVDDFPEDWINPTPNHTGRTVPRLRGMMVSTGLTSAQVTTLASWNANLVRWQLGGTAYPDGLSTTNYTTVLNAELAKLDAILPSLEAAGIMVVVDLHTLSMKLFDNRANQDRLIATWKTIAAKYKDTPAVWGYDIANEPVDLSPWRRDLLNWNELAERVSLAIREVDAHKTIIVESTDWASPADMTWQRPVRARNIVYSIHYYMPSAFTHWRVTNDTDAYVQYPGTIGTTAWNQTTMLNSLAPVIAFQDKYDVHIYVGEFSAVRWVEGAYAYLNDATELFETLGWDWSYHAFAEWHGWKAELGTVKSVTTPPPTRTDREQLLRDLFDANVRPAY